MKRILEKKQKLPIPTQAKKESFRNLLEKIFSFRSGSWSGAAGKSYPMDGNFLPKEDGELLLQMEQEDSPEAAQLTLRSLFLKTLLQPEVSKNETKQNLAEALHNPSDCVQKPDSFVTEQPSSEYDGNNATECPVCSGTEENLYMLRQFLETLLQPSLQKIQKSKESAL